MNATVTPFLLPFSGGQRDDQRGDGDGHDGREGDPPLVDPAPDLPAGHRAVAAERVHHARGAGHAAHAAEHLADHGDDQDELDPAGPHRALEDREDGAAALVDLLGVRGRREGEGQEQDVAGDGRVEHRPPDALRGGLVRSVRLLGDVRRGVVAGDRVLREQEAQRQHVPPEHVVAEAGVVLGLREDGVEARVVGGDDDQDDDQRRGADHVPEHRDAVEPGDEGPSRGC